MTKQEISTASLRLSRASVAILLSIIAICSFIEIALTASDYEWVGPARSRLLVYEYAGFWPGLLNNWQPNYPLQPYAMFLTYGFLHGGLMHLFVNMYTLWTVGRVVNERVGASGFVLLYIASLFGGAAGFGLLASNLTPMVGASGALFGLIGGLLAWGYVDRFNFNENLWPIGRAVLILLALNLILWWAMDGQLAWETHLGGFVSGWIVALLIDPRPRN